MKERNKYHVADIANIVVFYCVFICFFVAFIMGIIDFAKGNLVLSKLIFRTTFVLLMFIPFLIKKIFNVTFSRIVSTTFYLYMFISAFLGNVLEFYQKYPAWDLIIHYLMGAVLAVLSIYVLNLTIYKKDRAKHNMFFTYSFMLLFACGVGALWEIWEFSGDLIFGLNTQRYMNLLGQRALMDTMLDLCMDLLGAISGILFTSLMIQLDRKFLKSFVVTKLRHKEQEIENIEE